MDEQHAKLINKNNFVPKEGQRLDLACCNEESLYRCPSFGVEELIITPNKINIFTNFAISLKKIHTRLLMEGYIIENGKICKPNEK